MFMSLLTWPSRLRYLAWRTARLAPSCRFILKSGETLTIGENWRDDFVVALQVFADGAYRAPKRIDPASVGRIVDVGANVGFSLLHFGREFPMARFEAFEPHPGHLVSLRRNLVANGLTNRVVVHAAGAGAADGALHLTDDGSSSTVVHAPARATIPVQIVDFFEAIEPGRIDLLKMDCEGGEWDIVMDPRFETLDIGTIVLEWHARFDHPRADFEISQRLERLGWTIWRGKEFALPDMRVGVLWAFR
jgi:FkbM family methyltransferase